jgi:glucokinase
MNTGLRIGLDIGGTTTRAGLLRQGSTEVLHTVALGSGRGPKDVLSVALQVVENVLHAADLAPQDVAAIGVACPGSVDRRDRSVTHAVNLGIGSEAMHLNELGDKLDIPVNVQHDVKAAALGAARFMPRPLDLLSLAYLNVGTGIAAGFVRHGEVAPGAAGEVGHIVIREGGPRCGRGQRGCIEAISSGSALERRWPRIGEFARGDLSDSLVAGDETALALWRDVMDGLAALVQIVVLTHDPEFVVFGGGVVENSPEFVRDLERALGERIAASPFLQSLQMASRIHVAEPEWQVGIVGAAELQDPD